MKPSPWRGVPVLVTGCTGLLGSWLARALAGLGAEVVGLVRDWVPGSELVLSGTLARIRTARGCLEDYALMERVLGEYEIDTVFHLGAQTIVGIANRNPLSTFEANVRGTWTLLEACRRAPTVRRVVVASSDKAYGEHRALPYREDFPLQGRHPYDVSKSCADLIAQSYAKTFRLPVCVTRCGNLYGGGDLNFNRLVPGTIRSALLGERPVLRSDGSALRDYFYVEDAVEANLRLAEAMKDPSLRGEAFNFGNDDPQTAAGLARRVLELAGRKDLKLRILGTSTNEIPRQHLSAAKARRRLGWRPRFDLTEGLRRTIAWYEGYLGHEKKPEEPAGPRRDRRGRRRAA